jgi:hypothetical protein
MKSVFFVILSLVLNSLAVASTPCSLKGKELAVEQKLRSLLVEEILAGLNEKGIVVKEENFQLVLKQKPHFSNSAAIEFDISGTLISDKGTEFELKSCEYFNPKKVIEMSITYFSELSSGTVDEEGNLVNATCKLSAPGMAQAAIQIKNKASGIEVLARLLPTFEIQ